MYLPVARGWFGRQAMWTDPFEAVEDSRAREVIFAVSQEERAVSAFRLMHKMAMEPRCEIMPI